MDVENEQILNVNTTGKYYYLEPSLYYELVSGNMKFYENRILRLPLL